MVLAGAFAAGLVASLGQAQETRQPDVVCTVEGCREIVLPKPRYSDASAFSVQQVWSVVNDILSVSGLLPNFQVVETDEVGNAAAVIIDGERYLAFNPGWIARYKSDPNAKWQLLGGMAHEVGHHLQGHTITGTGSRPPTELEADEYAGFTLAALGASLQQAQSLWATLPESGSATHPPRHQRLDAIERGWMRYVGRNQGQQPASVPAQPAPAPAPAPVVTNPPAWAMRNCAPVYAAGQYADLCFSSYLAPQGKNTYVPQNALDADGRTAWIEGVAGQGIGETFLLVFDDPTRVNGWSLRNGYTKSDKVYWRNSRVRRLKLTFSNGRETWFNIDDTPDWQSTDALAQYGPVSWILFEITEVFPGSHYKDTAITELLFE